MAETPGSGRDLLTRRQDEVALPPAQVARLEARLAGVRVQGPDRPGVRPLWAVPALLVLLLLVIWGINEWLHPVQPITINVPSGRKGVESSCTSVCPRCLRSVPM